MITTAPAAIALGSNLGDSLSHLRKAAEALRQLSASPHLTRWSHIYRTAPVACPPNSPFFLNAVIEIDWKGSVQALWNELKQLEMATGRRYPYPLHAPRTLDLDILYLGSLYIPQGPIFLPHPRLRHRRFVLTPLADCAPNRVLPNEKLTVAELLAALPSSDSTVEKIDAPLYLSPLSNY